MWVTCQQCGYEQRVALRRGVRLAECRCACGGEVRRLRQAVTNAGKRFAPCPVCGRKRLGGAPCFCHHPDEIAAAAAGETGGGAA